MRYVQGSPTNSAGNTFTPQQNGSYTYYNFENELYPNNVITYQEGAAPQNLNNGAYNFGVVPNLATNNNTCPSQIYCGSPGQLGPALLLQHETAKQAYFSLKYVYASLIDGGDFDGLKETIMLTWPNDAWELRNQLLAKSPYLSVEILMEAANKNILPDAMMLEICLANPEATQEKGFVKWIEFEAQNPLPDYMIAQIVASWNEKTMRASLVAGMAEQRGNMTQANSELIGLMRNDSTTVHPLDSIVAQWQRSEEVGARYAEVLALVEGGHFDDANAILEALDDDRDLKGTELLQQQDLLDLMGLWQDIAVNGQRANTLDSTHLAELNRIADLDHPTKAVALARNALCFHYGDCRSPYTGSSLGGPRSPSTLPSRNYEEEDRLAIFPNPASVFVTFEYQAAEGQIEVVVTDVTGREAMRRMVDGTQGQFLWDTRNIPRGVYMVELRSGGQNLQTERLVLQ